MAPTPDGLGTHGPSGTYPSAAICSAVSPSNCWRSRSTWGGGSTGWGVLCAEATPARASITAIGAATVANMMMRLIGTTSSLGGVVGPAN
jgi:hypothetical protein